MTPIHLRAGGTSVVLDLPERGLPRVLHWGPDLGPLGEPALEGLAAALRSDHGDSALYGARPSILPLPTEGWMGRPGALGSRDGRAFALGFSAAVHTVRMPDVDDGHGGPAGAAGAGAAGAGDAVASVRSVAHDTETLVDVVTTIELHPSGLVRVRAEIVNTSPVDDYVVDGLTPVLPVPPTADELYDFTGRHTLERQVQRRPFTVGLTAREARSGRPGHDASTLLCAGRRGFGFREGRVWGVHVADSGSQIAYAERGFNGAQLLGGGELLESQEIRLAPGTGYSSPWLVASWGEGLDDLSARIHRFLRARPHHPVRPRPVLLNTWEAVYFDHDLDRLVTLAERGAALGIERYVLDDGWFRHRRDDRAGLGDWYVDETVWPDGLHPLVDRVRELGMEFGLWFEPEMINLDSDLARAHPEWIFDTGHGPGLPSRYQHVLDLGHPEVYEYLLERISSLVAEYDIAYLKWDHNRPLAAAGHAPTGTPGVHAHTRALYRLLDELRRRHPGLEIESCCGGGGRIDLGILERTDRVWASDCIDAHDRLDIQRGTSALLPPELVGTHIGSPEAHTTLRTLDLGFRAGVALWGHLGVEWDVTALSPEEEQALAAWIALHKELRPLLHSGVVVHADLADDAVRVEGVVAADGSDALFQIAAPGRTVVTSAGRVPLPGLDRARDYRVELQAPGDGYPALTRRSGWMRSGGIVLPGSVLADVGLDAPQLHPDHLVLVRVRALDS